MSKKYTKLGRYTVFWDEIYFIAYAGGKRELPEKDQKEYDRIAKGSMPDVLKTVEIKKLGNEKNPNLIPIKGIDLLSIIKEANYMPFFDKFFDVSKTLQVNNAIIYESMRQKSYEIAMGI